MADAEAVVDRLLLEDFAHLQVHIGGDVEDRQRACAEFCDFWAAWDSHAKIPNCPAPKLFDFWVAS